MISQQLELITAKIAWAVSLAEAKRQLEVETSDWDTIIQDLIYVAQEQVEDYCNLDLTAATYDLHLSEFPANGIILPKSPIASITHIKYYDSDNVQQTWAASNYYYNIHETPFKIRYSDSQDSPSVYNNRSDSISVRFVTGYTSPDTVPKKLKQAVLIATHDLFETRGDARREAISNWKNLITPEIIHHSTVENYE